MDVGQISTIVAALPEAKDIGGKNFWNGVVPKFVPLIIDEIVGSYDFDFAVNEYSDVTTVANQANYELEGESKDLRDIINIRIGDSNAVLAKLRPLDADDLLDTNDVAGGVGAWYQFGLSGAGFPVITLVRTPTVGGDALKVRYRKNNIPIEDLPDEFGFLIVSGVLGWILPAKRVQDERLLTKVIKRYRYGGKDINRASAGPNIEATNMQISNIYGSG